MSSGPIPLRWFIPAAALFAVIAITPVYYATARAIGLGSSFWEIFACTAGVAVGMVIGYQIFFLVQSRTLGKPARVISSSLDARIPFIAVWVWVYGALYYALLGAPVIFIAGPGECFNFIVGGFVLPVLLSPIYLLFPTACPPEWRRFEVRNASRGFLRLIQRFDNGRTCLPSLHCVLAAYSAMFLPVSPLTLLFPLLVSASCVLVKQHSVVDLLPSLVLGFAWGILVRAVL